VFDPGLGETPDEPPPDYMDGDFYSWVSAQQIAKALEAALTLA
jgi:hypothetical protein